MLVVPENNTCAAAWLMLVAGVDCHQSRDCRLLCMGLEKLVCLFDLFHGCVLVPCPCIGYPRCLLLRLRLVLG